jgi:HKD family nuclease
MVKCLNHINLSRFFSNSKETWIAVALMQNDIAVKLLKSLSYKDNGLIHIVIGIDLSTEPEALETLYNAGCDVKIYSSDITFHPKVYVVKKRNGRYSSIIGSANATHSGFQSNVEFSVENNDTEFCKSVIDWFNRLNSKHLHTIDSSFLTAYKKEFEDRKLSNMSSNHANLRKRIKGLWKSTLEYNRLELLQEIRKGLSEVMKSSVFQDRDNVVSELREAMDVNHGFKHFDSAHFFSIAELGRIRTSHHKAFLQPATIKAIANAYTAENNSIAKSIDELCGCDSIGIGYASKIMCVRDPKRFMIINGPSIDFLKKYGIKGLSGKITGEKYLQICSEISKILDVIPEVVDLAHFDAIIVK